MTGLADADPRVGQTLRLEGTDWEVTDQSSYWSQEGYRVIEWECETEDTEAYLLKEIREGAPIRWFFTRGIDADAVTLPAGDRIGPWRAKNPTAAPPPTLGYQGQSYALEETTDGTYEDEPGKRVKKTTWDYWDASHAHNLAVEIWQSGEVDCYHGAYIEPGQVVLGAAPESAEADASAGPAEALRLAARLGARATGPGRPSGLSANPFLAAAVCVPLGYVIPFFMGWPFDKSIGVALCLAVLGGWLFALLRAPLPAVVALLGVPVLLFVFSRFPPLSTGAGVAALVATPIAVTWGGGGGGGRRAAARLPVVYAAAFPVMLSGLALGVNQYFRFAPQPHNLGQLVLALGPGVIGGVAASVVAAIVLAATHEPAS